MTEIKKYVNECGNLIDNQYIKKVKDILIGLESVVSIEASLVSSVSKPLQGHFFMDMQTGHLICLSDYGICIISGGVYICLNDEERINKYIKNKQIYEGLIKIQEKKFSL